MLHVTISQNFAFKYSGIFLRNFTQTSSKVFFIESFSINLKAHCFQLYEKDSNTVGGYQGICLSFSEQAISQNSFLAR